MARFYRIQIENIFLTSTGLSGGLPCKLAVDGVDALFLNFLRSVAPSADNTPIVQTFAFDKGKPLDILIESLPMTVGESLLTLFNDSMENATTLAVVGTDGDTGDFTAECEFLDFQFNEFSSGFWKNALIKLVTVS